MRRETKQKRFQRIAASIIAIIIAFIMLFSIAASFMYTPASVNQSSGKSKIWLCSKFIVV